MSDCCHTNPTYCPADCTLFIASSFFKVHSERTTVIAALDWILYASCKSSRRFSLDMMDGTEVGAIAPYFVPNCHLNNVTVCKWYSPSILKATLINNNNVKQQSNVNTRW